MIPCQQLTSALSAIESKSVPILSISLSDKQNVVPGTHFPKAETQTPAILYPGELPIDKTYLIALLDLDAPAVSFSFLSPILHLLQSDLRISDGQFIYAAAAGDNGEGAIAPYRPANPPPGVAPHRYVYLVYIQPETFRAEKFRQGKDGFGLAARVRFNWDEFVRENGLGDVVAATYFTSN